jgi:bacterial/archaeal transporter family protein
MKSWYAYSMLTVLLWGFWGVFTKLAVAYSKPRSMLLFQAVGVLAFAVLVLFLLRFSVEWSAKGFVFSFFGGLVAFVGFLTFFLALEQGSVSTVVTLSALYPVVTILFSIAFLREKLSGTQGLGIILALIASVLLAR